MPRHNKRSMTVRERVLLPEGGVETIMLDDRYTPYDRQNPRIENLCGSFTEFVQTAGLHTVIAKATGQKELYHLHGNVVINQGRGSFLAVRGMHGLRSLSQALGLSTPRNVVHMVVLTSKMGRRVQVSPCSHPEKRRLSSITLFVRRSLQLVFWRLVSAARTASYGSWAGCTSIPTQSGSQLSGSSHQ